MFVAESRSTYNFKDSDITPPPPVPKRVLHLAAVSVFPQYEQNTESQSLDGSIVQRTYSRFVLMARQQEVLLYTRTFAVTFFALPFEAVAPVFRNARRQGCLGAAFCGEPRAPGYEHDVNVKLETGQHT